MTDLHAAIEEYVTLRRSLGYKLDRVDGLLHQFADHLQQQRHGTTITTAAALEWAMLPRQATAWWWRQRLSVVRGFARYLQAVDPSVEVPPKGLIPASAPRATPHIYSDADIAALLDAAGGVRSPLRAATYQTLIGLLAVTGMRCGEAIGLDDDDVDVAQRVLLVRHGKFNKTRQLVVHPSTAAALAAYRHTRQAHLPQPTSPAFLLSTVGTRLFYPNVSALFRRLCRQAGLPGQGGRGGPCLHAFRHTFAVRWLVDWHRAGIDVGPRLPALSTYLGHARPAETYWYLSPTEELLRQAAGRLEAASGATA